MTYTIFSAVQDVGTSKGAGPFTKDEMITYVKTHRVSNDAIIHLNGLFGDLLPAQDFNYLRPYLAESGDLDIEEEDPSPSAVDKNEVQSTSTPREVAADTRRPWSLLISIPVMLIIFIGFVQDKLLKLLDKKLFKFKYA